jgi:hypothetical protein
MTPMIAALPEWPTWVRVAVIAPLAFAFGAPVYGWWPKNARDWRLFGTLLACFTVCSVAMICALHA